MVGKFNMYINRGNGNLNDTAVWYVDGYGGCCGTVNLTMGPRWQMVALGQSRRNSATSNGDGISAIAAKFMYNYTANTTLAGGASSARQCWNMLWFIFFRILVGASASTTLGVRDGYSPV